MNVYSVSQINSYIKSVFYKDNVLNCVCIRGEVSNCKYHTSGHIYFSLKDEAGQLSCVMFAGKRAGLSFRMSEGQAVRVLGRIDIYERDGKYQLYAEHIEQEGLGALYERFEMLKRKLEAEGLFEQAHKMRIPPYISKLGIITAGTGAALQDILNITKRRNPYVQPVLYPAKVQGEGAARTLIDGIRYMETEKPDVIIIGRGGGSIEDLWAFNDEELARAVYQCKIPVISAVGHETDFTIIDFVSDLRAPTPSAAAELAVYEYSRLHSTLIDLHSQLYSLMSGKIMLTRAVVDRHMLLLKAISPMSRLNSEKQRLADANIALDAAINKKIDGRRHELAILSERLNGVSPLNKLALGYSYVTGKTGHNIRSVKDVSKGEEISIKTSDGIIDAVVTDTAEGDRTYGKGRKNS